MVWPIDTGGEWSHLLVDFPGYRFRRDGTVWSCWVRGSKNRRMSTAWHEIKPRKNTRRDYLYVTLVTPAGRKHLRVNVLILWAFTGHRPAGMEAAHKDGDRLNNHVENLEWKTHLENIADKSVHGTVLRGAAIGNSKLTEPQVVEIKSLIADGVSPSAIASGYGVSDSLIRLIRKGQRWSHVGVPA